MSVTDMYECTHGPKKDCHACLVRELVKALENLMYTRPDGTSHISLCEEWNSSCRYSCIQVRAVLEKANALYAGPAEVPLDHGHE